MDTGLQVGQECVARELSEGGFDLDDYIDYLVEFTELRLLGRAPVLGERATGAEAAPGRRVGGRGQVSAQHDLLAAAAQPRIRGCAASSSRRPDGRRVPVSGLVVTSVDVDMPLEVTAAMRGEDLVFLAQAPQERGFGLKVHNVHARPRAVTVERSAPSP